MKRFIITLLATGSLLHADPIVGRIGDISLAASEVEALLKAAADRAGEPLQADAAALNSFVRATLVQRLVLAKALAAGHEKKPEIIAELARAKDAALVESFLRSASEPPPAYPSESQLEAFYQENKAELVVPKSWRIAQIFISDSDPADPAAAKSKLDAVLKQLKEPNADFASIARTSSDDRASAVNGGELGWLQDNLIQPAIREKLPLAKLGENSAPIRMDDGWHIIRLLDAREARTPTLDELRPRLRATLRANKAREGREAYLAELLESNPAAVNEIELIKLTP